MTQTFDSHHLAAMVIAKRDGRGLRATAAEIGGVSASTLSRIEQGKVPDLDTFLRLCRWLGVSADEFADSPSVHVPEDDGQRADIIAAHLRADRTLDRATARALERMVRLAYQAAAADRLLREDGD
jgi:transcriptional regulator with XRE-family HTH domain